MPIPSTATRAGNHPGRAGRAPQCRAARRRRLPQAIAAPPLSSSTLTISSTGSAEDIPVLASPPESDVSVGGVVAGGAGVVDRDVDGVVDGVADGEDVGGGVGAGM